MPVTPDDVQPLPVCAEVDVLVAGGHRGGHCGDAARVNAGPAWFREGQGIAEGSEHDG